MEIYDIITLDNNKDYVIIKSLQYNNKEYLLLNQVDENENLLDEKIVLEKKFDEGYYLVNIENNNLKQIIQEKFAKLLLEDIK